MIGRVTLWTFYVKYYLVSLMWRMWECVICRADVASRMFVTAGLHNMVTTLLAPFSRRRTLSGTDLHHLIRFGVRRNVSNLCINNSANRTFMRDLSRHRRMLRVITRRTGNRVGLVTRINYIDATRDRRLTTSTGHCNFSTISTIAPFCCPFDFRRRYSRCQTVVSSTSNLPVIICGVPTLDKMGLALSRVGALIALPNMNTLGRASNSLCRVRRVHHRRPSLILCGNCSRVFTSNLLTNTSNNVNDACGVVN